MRKILPIAVAAAIVIYCGLAWAMGYLVQAHVDTALARITTRAPYVTIVRSSFHRGWFTSTEDVTFQVTGIRTPSLLRHVANGPGVPPAQVLRLSVHNVIHHGPVCGLTCIGIARVDSHLIFGAKAQPIIARLYGKREPLRIRTRYGFFGGGTLTIDSPPIRDVALAQGGRVSWEGLHLRAKFSRHSDRISERVTAPRLAVTDAGSRRFELDGVHLKSDLQRAQGQIYTGDAEFIIDRFTVQDDPGKGSVSVDRLEYGLHSDAHAGFMTAAVRIDAGPVTVQGHTLSSVHDDITLRHLDLASLNTLMTAVQTIQSHAALDPQLRVAQLRAALRACGVTLLTHQPEISIDQISVATADGTAKLIGNVRLDGVTAIDFAPGNPPAQLLRKLDAHLDFTLDDHLLTGIPGYGAAAEQRLQAFARAGFVTRTNGHTHSKIVLRNGGLTLNGRPLALPGARRAPTLRHP